VLGCTGAALRSRAEVVHTYLQHGCVEVHAAMLRDAQGLAILGQGGVEEVLCSSSVAGHEGRDVSCPGTLHPNEHVRRVHCTQMSRCAGYIAHK